MTKTTIALGAFFRSQIAKDYLSSDLLFQYDEGMEIQVNVAQCDGRPGDRKGTFQDSMGNMWYNFRIPKNANREDAYYNDPPLNFSLGEKAADIGMTGWNWQKKQSMWVAFDFDTIVGHADGVGITDEALAEVKRKAMAIPWVQVRRSTSGTGIHLYVFFEEPPHTVTHTEHAALGRAVLDKMSMLAGFNFGLKVDACGGNMWVWSRRANEENRGFEVIKDHEEKLLDIPDNWEEHLDVVRGKRHKIRFAGVPEEEQKAHEDLAVQERVTALDAKHHAVIEKLSEFGASTFWSSDHQLIQTHTKAFEWLMNEHQETLGLVGRFETDSPGTDLGEPNCFAFPVKDGGWKVYRFGGGSGSRITEAETWTTTSNGWTQCYFNAFPDFAMVLENTEAIEVEQNVWQYPNFDDLQAALKQVDCHVTVEAEFRRRTFELSKVDDTKIKLSFDKKKDDETPEGWGNKGRKWIKVVTIKQPEGSAAMEYDHKVRHLLDPTGCDLGFHVKIDTHDGWCKTATEKTKYLLQTESVSTKELPLVLGQIINNSWTLVHVPFGPEHPGPRQWNLDAPQFAFPPADHPSPHPAWDMIFSHSFQTLDKFLPEHPWGQENGILTGKDYAYTWIASMLRYPFDPLPYLFFHGPENSGKTIIADAISLLLTSGVARIDEALKAKGPHNGELAGAVFGYIDETDISSMRAAEKLSVQNKVKDLVTSRQISIRKMYQDAYMQDNTLHIMQFTNQHDNCCVSSGDTRIVACFVPRPEVQVPKIGPNGLITQLEKQAPAFLRTIMDWTIPDPVDRLRVPMIKTDVKERLENAAQNPLESWIAQSVNKVPGHMIKTVDFINTFRATLAETEKPKWNRTKILASLNDDMPRGKGKGNQDYIGNVSFDPKAKPMDQLYVKDGRLKKLKKEEA